MMESLSSQPSSRRCNTCWPCGGGPSRRSQQETGCWPLNALGGQEEWGRRRKTLESNIRALQKGILRIGDDEEDLDDQPGIYKITHKCGLSETAEVGKVFAIIYSGQDVEVVQVWHDHSNSRIRGHIQNPEGWISLLNTETRFRWAIWSGPRDPRDDEIDMTERDSYVSDQEAPTLGRMPTMTATPTFTKNQKAEKAEEHMRLTRSASSRSDDQSPQDRFQIGKTLGRRGRSSDEEQAQAVGHLNTLSIEEEEEEDLARSRSPTCANARDNNQRFGDMEECLRPQRVPDGS